MSVKPDDIPQDIWEAAYRAMPPVNQKEHDCSPYAMVLRVGFARAIMAAKAEEQEECAQLAEELPRCELKTASPGVSVERSFKTGADVQAMSIAKAIRNRVNPNSDKTGNEKPQEPAVR